MRVRVIVALCLATLCGCSGGSSHDATNAATHLEKRSVYAPPGDSVASLLTTLAAVRDREGKVVLQGCLLLPAGTKVMLSLRRAGAASSEFAQSEVRIGADGSFETDGFTNGGALLPPGLYQAEILSYFNEMWQTPDVLAHVGVGGARLPSHLLLPDDPEFPKHAGHFKSICKVVAPGVAPELLAIESVKSARLSTPENGRSADNVGGVVALMESAYSKTDPDNLRSTGWSAAVQPDSTWVVTMVYLDSHRPRQAHWAFDPKSNRVRYLDPEAKIFSWSPSY